MANTPRLKAVESLVPHGTRLLDIGSDHGLLPAELFKAGVISRAFVTDINAGPLANSRRQLAQSCPDKQEQIDFALSDGFAAVPHGTYDMAAICGMGGELIAKIIEQGGTKAQCPMILQPMSVQDKLRAYLWQKGYQIETELFPTEGRRAYVVMLVSYTGTPTEYTVEDAFLGKLRPQTQGFSAYAKAVHAAAQKRYNGAKLSGNNGALNAAAAVMAAAAMCF